MSQIHTTQGTTVITRRVRFDNCFLRRSLSPNLTSIITTRILRVHNRKPIPFRHGLVRIAGAEFRHLLRHLGSVLGVCCPRKGASDWLFKRIAGLEERAAECTLYGMQWLSIIVITSVTAVTFGRSPNPDLSRAEELYQRTEYGRAIDVVQAVERRDAASYALLGKAFFMEGHYKQAISNLEKAIGQDSVNSGYHDWLGRAYGRLAEESSFLSALGCAKKTVRAFERAVELDPSNLEALSDVFEYYLQAPGMVGGGLDKAESIAKRFAGLNAAEYHWARARLAEKRRDFETAEREFRAAFATDPNEVGRVLDLAAFLSSRGRYGESDALFQSAEDNHPHSPKVLYARAAAYIHSKRKLDRAEALLDRYITMQITPEDPSRREAAALLKSARDVRPKCRPAE